MKKRHIEQVIGLTIDFTIDFSSNGMQQNIIFLANCINSIPGRECYLIYFGDLIKNNFLREELCISYIDYINKNNLKFDIVIYSGFNPGQKNHLLDKQNNKSTKYVSIQYGNELVIDMQETLNGAPKKLAEIITPLDQIWTSPHYERNIPYLKTKNKNNNIKLCPYIWDDLFIKNQLTHLNINQSIENYKSGLDINRVSIFEPNLNFSKTSLLPINIVERFEQNYSNVLESCSVLSGGDRLAKNTYFLNLILSMDIYKKRKGFLKCIGRIPFLDAISKYGGLVISHQFNNELNYIYFEALYLSLPLIHNSDILSNYGYYYHDCDIDKGVNWINYILDNHKNNIDQYDKNNMNLFKKYSPYSRHNIEAYKSLLDQV